MTERKRTTAVFQSLRAGLLLFAIVARVQSADRPNIIVILTDDTGWNGLSIRADPEIAGSGSTYYQTPNTDKLAARGVRFSMTYSPSPTCGPSRTSVRARPKKSATTRATGRP